MTAKKNPRVTAFLDQAEFVGGAEHFMLDFFKTLSSQDIRRLTPVLIGGKSNEYNHQLPKEISVLPFNYPSVSGPVLYKVWAVFKLFIAALKLKKLLKSQKVTQVFTNTPRTHFIMWFVRILGYRGRWSVMFHDFTTRPNKLINLIAGRANVLIANSLATRNWLHDTIDKKHQSKVKIVENGINFNQIPTPKPATEITKVLNLGRIDSRKGQKYFVEAADLLLERNPDLEFTIIGDPVKGDPFTQKYNEEIKAFAAQRKLQNLTFFPSVKDPLKTINEYDLLVFTPTEPETFGRVVIEALALGKMVIAFDQTGPKEIIGSFINQYPDTKKAHFSPLVEVANSMSLAETIGYFADNPKKINPFTENGPNFVETNFNLDETKKRLLDTLL